MRPNELNLPALARLLTRVLCTIPVVANAGQQHLTCPASIDTMHMQADVLPGWTGLIHPKGTLRFQSAEAIFAVGPLQEAAWGELKDPLTTKKGDTVVAKFELPPSTDKYVICYYEQRVYRALKLPMATNECEVVYSPDGNTASVSKAKYRISDIICR